MPIPNLPAPVKVSPLIKLFRYAFLIAGIFYGSSRRTYLKHKEMHVREKQQKIKAERDAKLAQEKKIAGEKELGDLEKMFVPQQCPTAHAQPVETHSVRFEEKKDPEKAPPYHTENVSETPINNCLSDQSNTPAAGKDDFTSKPINLKPKREEPVTVEETLIPEQDAGDLIPNKCEEAAAIDEAFSDPDIKEKSLKSYYFKDETSTSLESADSLPFVPTPTQPLDIEDNVYKDFDSVQWDEGYFVKDFSKGIPFETAEPRNERFNDERKDKQAKVDGE